MREFENMIISLQKYLSEHEDDLDNGQNVDALVQQFMEQQHGSDHCLIKSDKPETSEDYLLLAERASSKKKKKEYLQKSLELDQDNLDAGRMLAELEAKTREELLLRMRPLLVRADELMRQGGYYQDCTGDFWAVVETRPYMRLHYLYMTTMADCGMLRKAVKEGEALLELCSDDNLGVRFDLMHLYACLDDEDAAMLLFDEYKGEKDTQMLLPLAVLFYRQMNFEKSLALLKILCKVNKDARKFIRAVDKDKLDDYEDQVSIYAYQPGTMSELLYDYIRYLYLYDSVDTFFEWANWALKSK